jgi:hypothetical protein
VVSFIHQKLYSILKSSWFLKYRRLDQPPSCTGTVEKIPLPQLEIQSQVTAIATPEF